MKLIRAAKAIIVVGDQALVLRHSETHPVRPFLNDLPGGIVEEGELVEEGLVREIREEVSFDVDSRAPRLVHASTEHFSDDVTYIHHIFIVRLEDKPTITLSYEHDQFWWKRAAEIEGFEAHYQMGVDYVHEHSLLKYL